MFSDSLNMVVISFIFYIVFNIMVNIFGLTKNNTFKRHHFGFSDIFNDLITFTFGFPAFYFITVELIKYLPKSRKKWLLKKSILKGFRRIDLIS